MTKKRWCDDEGADNNVEKRMRRRSGFSWQDLLGDIMNLILNYVDLRDHLRLRAVCVTWKQTVDSLDHLLKISTPPWMAFSRHPKRSICSLLGGDQVTAAAAAATRVLGFFGDEWIVLQQQQQDQQEDGGDVVVSLVDLCRDRRIALPSPATLLVEVVEDNPNRKKPLSILLDRVMLSASPTSGDCVVVAQFDGGRLALCRPGEEEWSYFGHDYARRIMRMMSGDNYLILWAAILGDNYWRWLRPCSGAVFYKGRLVIPDPRFTTLVLVEFGCGRAPNFSVLKLASKFRYPKPLHMEYLVGSEEHGLLLVSRSRRSRRFGIGVRTVWFQVYRLDGEEEGRPRWVELASIGNDRCLLLGFVCCKFVPTKAFPRLRGNCIYFAQDDNIYGNIQLDMGVFSLDDKKIGSFGLEELTPNNNMPPLFLLMSQELSELPSGDLTRICRLQLSSDATFAGSLEDLMHADKVEDYCAPTFF